MKHGTRVVLPASVGLRAIGAAVVALLLTASDPLPAAAADACADLPSATLVAQLDGRSQDARLFEPDRELRQLVLYCYRNLADDIVNGRGLYLEALAHRFRRICANDDALLAWLRLMLRDAKDAPELSRRMAVALHLTRATTE
jgi:hypothetical protein